MNTSLKTRGISSSNPTFAKTAKVGHPPLESGDFFQGLQSRSTATGTEFRKKSINVETFPDKLTVRVLAGLDACDPRKSTPQSGADLLSDFHFDTEFLKSVTFEGFWKHGFETRKADVGLASAGRIASLIPLRSSADWWEYELDLRSRGVCLCDSLVIVVLAPDGRQVTRFSTRL
jgi:hypothetical protein